ncbi:unnamed protein product [Penicillium camemberti]|uniref:Str. FM013 n=1 Tax=Penicillium camemberti (strain FM 013) TaxID=1429867 RepID=A0A0G4PMS6_PENC3|nr:unnamed protein product [Penicillium camemberti]
MEHVLYRSVLGVFYDCKDLRWVTAFTYDVLRTRCYYEPLFSPIDGGQIAPRVFADLKCNSNT